VTNIEYFGHNAIPRLVILAGKSCLRRTPADPFTSGQTLVYIIHIERPWIALSVLKSQHGHTQRQNEYGHRTIPL